MRTFPLKDVRVGAGLTQREAAARLGVTQAYFSMLERGLRPMTVALAAKVAESFELASLLPVDGAPSKTHDNDYFRLALGALGYPGFGYLKSERKTNHAVLLLEALKQEDLDARVVEALPWLAAALPKADWDWLTRAAKELDRQNRLAFVLALAAQSANKRGDADTEMTLAANLTVLERSRLAAEDTLCKRSMSEAERRWLRTHRSPVAAHWNLLSDLSIEHLPYAR